MKFTPNICYLLGLWWHCRSRRGVGVKGRGVAKFLEIMNEEGMLEPEKLQYSEDEVFFYHHRIKNALKRYVESRKHRLRFANEYSASYLAGWFDCCGEIDEGRVKLCNADVVDKYILSQLNFQFDEVKNKIIVRKPLAFLTYVKDYVHVTKGEVESVLSVARKR